MNSQLSHGFSVDSAGVRDFPVMIREAARNAGLPDHSTALDRLGDVCRRAVEIVVAVIALILISPILLAITILVRSNSPGPAVFRQTRVGKEGNLFTFYKFRTLFHNARELFPEMYAYRYTAEQLRELPIHFVNDPRITSVGKWLRKSSLDELPNFWNLLKGDVALVGPRPQIPELLQYHVGEELIKFYVKPGITGLAQVRGRGSLLFQDGIRHDIEYVKNRSVALDLRILAMTVKQVIRLDGAF